MLYNASRYNEATSFLVKDMRQIFLHMTKIIKRIKRGETRFGIPVFPENWAEIRDGSFSIEE